MKNDHIFISIASYRDPYLPHTIETALENARHPDNLHFGICWQRDETESLDPYTSDTDMGGVPLLKCVGISEAGEVDLQMSTRRASEPNTRTYFLCANFVFTHGSWITEVPCDPHIHQYGEEANLAIRSYTHGYDLFVPDRIKVGHLDYINYDPERIVHSKRAKIYREAEAQSLLERHAVFPIGRYGRWRSQGIADSIRDGFVAGGAFKS